MFCLRVIAATNNQGKVSEIKAILGELGIEVVSQREAGIQIEVEETGTTFEENAILKAKAVLSLAGEPVVADDSGLCVDALGGRPGVYSARYAGEGASDSMLVEKLLGELEGVSEAQRSARFVSVVAFCLPDGRTFLGEGSVEGAIAFAPTGQGGFGYDPVFVEKQSKKTFAEMSSEEKNKISHRYRALLALREELGTNL